MVMLRCSIVPEYLRNGEFYRNLDENDNEEFSVPEEHYKADTVVSTDFDIDRLLSTVQFWGSSSFPESIIEHMMQTEYVLSDELLDSYGECFPILTTIQKVRDSTPNQRMDRAIEHGSFEIVQYLHRQGGAFGAKSVESAAKVGSVPILQFMHENGHLARHDATRAAAGAGHLNCLQYLHSIGCPWNSEVGLMAARNGHLDCLTYVLENGHETKRKWDLCMQAARNGHHECLQYLLQGNCKAFTELLIPWAIDRGNVQCLQIAYEYVRLWRLGNSTTILKKKDLDCFVYSITNGCSYSGETACICAELGLLEHLQYIQEHTSLIIDEHTLQTAVNHGHLSCVQFLHECGCTWQTNVYSVVVEKNYYDCLVYMHEHGATFGVDDCTIAARYGHLQCLQYLHIHGAEWSVESCGAAASHGKLECLVYLHENGCPWDVQTTMDSMYQEDCYYYAKKHGCPVPTISLKTGEWVA